VFNFLLNLFLTDNKKAAHGGNSQLLVYSWGLCITSDALFGLCIGLARIWWAKEKPELG